MREQEFFCPRLQRLTLLWMMAIVGMLGIELVGHFGAWARLPFAVLTVFPNLSILHSAAVGHAYMRRNRALAERLHARHEWFMEAMAENDLWLAEIHRRRSDELREEYERNSNIVAGYELAPEDGKWRIP